MVSGRIPPNSRPTPPISGGPPPHSPVKPSLSPEKYRPAVPDKLVPCRIIQAEIILSGSGAPLEASGAEKYNSRGRDFYFPRFENPRAGIVRAQRVRGVRGSRLKPNWLHRISDKMVPRPKDSDKMRQGPRRDFPGIFGFVGFPLDKTPISVEI